MYSHIFTSVSDFDRAYNFYSAVFNELGVEPRFYEPDKPWAGWNSYEGGRPSFVICKPFNGESQHPGNGQMIAFRALTRAVVRSAYETAISHGGTDEGPPGLRPHYHENYYGAYFRDPDGNKLCVVCHEAESPETQTPNS